jgi:hypothetical protein
VKRAFTFLLAAGLLLASFATGADMILGPSTVSIRKGTFEYGPSAVPVNVTAMNATLSRENWPAGGIDIELLVSFDNAQTWVSPGPTHISPFVPDIKHTDVLKYPAQIGVGWNQEERQATHVKARTINPGSAFQSTITIEALVAGQ